MGDAPDLLKSAGHLLLGIVDPGQFSNNLDKLLEKREGLLGLAFATLVARRGHGERGSQARGPR